MPGYNFSKLYIPLNADFQSAGALKNLNVFFQTAYIVFLKFQGVIIGDGMGAFSPHCISGGNRA